MRFAVRTTRHRVRHDARAKINRAPPATPLRPLLQIPKLFGKVLPLLDDPFVAHSRSITGRAHPIKTGQGEVLRYFTVAGAYGKS